MLVRRIVGITGISLWSALIVIVVGAKLQGVVGGQGMFVNLPEGWKVEKSFAVPSDQRAAISQRLGGRISKLTNTILSIEGKQLQVNVLQSPTERGAEKIYKVMLDAHSGHTGHVAKDGDMVIEFAKSDDIKLMNRVRLALGLPDVQLDNVAKKVITKIPARWRLENSFVISDEQAVSIGEKLGGRIVNLSNAIFTVDGKRFQVNVIECATPQEAEKIHKSILEMKDNPAFCLMLGNMVVEFVGDDARLAKEAMYELGIKPRPGGEKQKESSGGQVEDMAKEFVDLLVEGEFEEAVANFDSTMRKALPTGKLQAVWNSLIAQAGPFVKQVGVRTEKILQYEAVFVTCKFERDVLDAKVVYDKEKRIAGLFFIPSQAATE